MFHPELRLLRCFAAIADTGSVTRAAERLHLTQSTLSGQIKELEQALGFSLFHRTTRALSLTAEGEHILPMVRAVLDQTEILRAEVGAMQGLGNRRFRLGAAMYSMDFEERLDLLEAFSEAVPGTTWQIDNRLQSNQVPDLLSGKLDAALLLGIAIPAHLQDAQDSSAYTITNETLYPDSLKRVVLCRRPMGLLVPDTAPLAHHRTIPREALAGQRVAILSTEHGHALVDPIERFLRAHGAEPVTLAEGNALAIERYAQRHGICAIGTGWFPTLPGVTFHEVDGMNAHLDFALVLGTSPCRAARRLFDFAGEWLALRKVA
jgi:DNA-binding transcriptional LysR family regulator